MSATLKTQGLYVDKSFIHRGESGACNTATGAQEYLLLQDLHWLALRQEKSTGRWFLHDNQEVQLIQDHKAYIEKLVAKSEDDWAIPLRSMSLRLHIDIDAIFFVITHHVIIPL